MTKAQHTITATLLNNIKIFFSINELNYEKLQILIFYGTLLSKHLTASSHSTETTRLDTNYAMASDSAWDTSS